MLTDAELIRKLDFFEALSPKLIQRIAQLCIVREFGADDYIVRQGESGLGLYFITAGRVKVEIERDGTKLVVAELKEGDFLGELAIIDDKARSANVICIEETRCLLLTRDSFAKLLKKHPEIALQMLRSLVTRIRSTNERISLPGSRLPQAALNPPPPPPEAPPPADSPSEPASASTLEGIGAAAERITAMIPKPEEVVRMYSSTKDQVKDYLVNVFGAIYLAKAMTRFSVAIVGCPVSVDAEKRGPTVFETTIEGVKLVVFPAHRDQTIRIEAFGDGELSATVFRPGDSRRNSSPDMVCFQGPIRRREVLWLRVPVGGEIGLESRAGGTDSGLSFCAAAGAREDRSERRREVPPPRRP